MLRSDLCDYSDAFIFVKERITVEVDNGAKKDNTKIQVTQQVITYYRPFQERCAIPRTCAHTRPKVFRRVINRTRK